MRGRSPGVIRRFHSSSVWSPLAALGRAACAGMFLAASPSVTLAQGDEGARTQDEAKGGDSVERGGDSHRVQDALQTGAKKVGDALNTGARKVGPAIDHGVETARKAVGKSADAVGSALAETGKKIEEKVGTKK